MEIFEENYFKHEDLFHEEITDEYNVDCERTKDEGVHSKISEADIDDLEVFDGSEGLTRNFGDLPNELILKVFSYSEPKELISSGQLSKRIRKISHDKSLWQQVNLSKKIVKTELLEMILSKGCLSLNLSKSTILGSLSLDKESQLRNLNLDDCTNIEVLEELLASCYSLEKLEMQYATIGPKLAASIQQNGKTLQILNLYYSFGLQEYTICNDIIRDCQELKEVYFGRTKLYDDDLTFLAKNISPKVEIIDLSYTIVKDDHVEMILSRSNKIKTLHLRGSLFITNDLVIKLLVAGHVCVRVRLNQNEYMKSSKNHDLIYSF